ncbi:MAG: DPP IV N-terminal domain-containing protein, partial [Thermaerobacterales bacterium]
MAVNFIEKGERQVGLIRPDGELLWRTYGPGPRAGLGWLDDSRLFYSETTVDYRRRTWHLLDLAAGRQVEIVCEEDEKSLGTPILPVSSPNRSRLVFVLRRSGWDHLYICDFSENADAAPRQITDGACEDIGHRNDRPCWSPDSRQICFSSNR